MNDMQSAAGTVAGSPDPEVTPKAKRRGFSAAYKKKILSDVDAAAGTGNIGEILPKKGRRKSKCLKLNQQYPSITPTQRRNRP